MSHDPLIDRAKDVLQQAEWENRLASVRGERLRLRDIAAVAGISKGKVRDDANRGNLVVVKVKCGQRWRFEVLREEARRYLAELFHAA